jgi:hypothetical protein
MEGFAVPDALWRDERTAAIPVVVLSAMVSEYAERQCYSR